MPESGNKLRRQRPSSDIIMDARTLLTEVEKFRVADSNKQVSMLLARSRSLDMLSSPSSSPEQLMSLGDTSTVGKDCNKSTKDKRLVYSPEERDCEQHNLYVSNCTTTTSLSADYAESSNNNIPMLKDNSSPNANSHKKDLTLAKEKSELNNNGKCNGSRSSSVSTASNCSTDSGNSNKVQRRSTASTEGATKYQDMVGHSEPIRITGYLEKRSKVLGWKKFYIVLDGRLLTYYKSKADYESLSACCGCINLGIASTVRPIQLRGSKGYPLQIVTRSQVYYLRSQEKPILEQWLIAIQEAASSAPSSSALTSWNSCSGSQYFRNSFTSQSQWSLNNSSEDITDITERLGNLPDTFYQKRDKGSLVFTNSQAPPLIHKYHSFASLQTPVVNNVGDNRRVMLSSSENLRDLPGTNKGNRYTMQHSTSLNVLNSSPQAAELRKELTRKLSIGSSKKTSSGSVDDDCDNNEETPTPKFLLSSAKKRSDVGDDESHHYDEIGDFVGKHYENSDVEKSVSTPGSTRSVRGELVEKDGNIYEQIETVDPTSNHHQSSGVWEPLNEGNSTNLNNKRLPHRLSAGSNRNSLVSISELPEDMSSISPSPIKTPNLTSIPEASWRSGVEPYKNYKTHSEDDLSSCRSESFRSLPCAEKTSTKKKRVKAFGGFLSKVFGKKGKNKSDSNENLHPPPMVISGPVDLRSMQLQNTNSEQEPSPTIKSNEKPLGKVDNNSQHAVSPGSKASPKLPGSKITINSSNVMDELKQKVSNGQINLKRTNSRNGSFSEPIPKEETNNQIKPISTNNKPEPRVPYVPRSLTITQSDKPKPIPQTPVLVFQTQDKVFESNTDDDDLLLNEHEKEIQVASISLSPDNETPIPELDAQTKEELPAKSIEPTSPVDEMDSLPNLPPNTSTATLRNNDPDDFQNKLAKFNRLSQRLSATFIAALNPSHVNPMAGQIGRSHSYKVNRNKGRDDPIPPLPPKKKNIPGGSMGTIPIYDVPPNNKPVSKKVQSMDSFEEEKSIAAYVRNLTKKNSTPDIVLSGNGSKPFFRDMLGGSKEFRNAFNGSEESFETHKSTPSLPPPRPPKPKPPAKPKSLDFDLNRIKRNSGSSSSGSSETITKSFPATPIIATQGLLELPATNTSPTASTKSLDIDNLDALSDAGLSDTKAGSSPPDSPKICPIHPDSALHDDSALSTDARTPDSESTMLTSDRIMPDSLATTPDTEIMMDYPNYVEQHTTGTDSDTEPISINKLEIVIRDNDGSPGLVQKSPDNDSRLDSLERKPDLDSIISNAEELTPTTSVYQNLKFATVSTLIQEFETVEEHEDEMSELYDDFPADFYTPTPSSFSGYSPSEVSTTSTESSPSSSSSSTPFKKHARIDSIQNSGMEQLEAFLSFGSTSSDDISFESCTDSFPEECPKLPSTPAAIPNNNVKKGPQFHLGGEPNTGGLNRTGAISRLGHSSAIGHLQKILNNDASKCT